MAARIPAWKKLGLQLKNSTTSPNEAGTGPPVDANTLSPSKIPKKRSFTSKNEEPKGKKQRVENGITGDERRARKAKNKAESKIPKKKGPDSELKTSIELFPVDQQDQKASSKLKFKKRNSVSFAEDTKSDDDAAHFKLEAEAEDDHEPTSASARKAELKRLKREQRAKNRPASNQQQQPPSSSLADSPHTHPVLKYLMLYHQHRAQWKFQKNRETHILKHALSIDQIPSKYNASLAAYLAGIKGEGAKKRVADVAAEAIKADDADVDSEKNSEDDAEKDGYRDAVASFRKRLVEHGTASHGWEGDMADKEAVNLNADCLKKLERRRRAELVLHFVGGRMPTCGTESKSKSEPVKKKKKNRTVVVEDTSSSSSSDSDSDSDSDDASSKHMTKQVNGTKSGDHSSSSLSSDPSSDSDSDTSSDSSSNSGSSSDSDSSPDSCTILNSIS
ncbi:uncharacterized protein PADG_00616 [Paracoccidioides brasiliensis Pb18]|uniref:WKF domain-containing protein n=1 Tax=Paracoccidioides brasiliensis (strain Pb18) TaxID=502780 RepID=C1G176_PARBD|nr:uncharacterized protein PADG_00616 [Paracoccidioides brasiliensis Pb18]EEH44327.2 hypothetical protein PADG_00616 [Paracoccidioides brasiliensis Pb18]